MANSGMSKSDLRSYQLDGNQNLSCGTTFMNHDIDIIFFSLTKFLYQEMVHNYIFFFDNKNNAYRIRKLIQNTSKNASQLGRIFDRLLRHLFLCLKCNKGHMLHVLNLIKKLLQLNRQQQLLNKCLPFFCRNANRFRSTSSKNGKFPQIQISTFSRKAPFYSLTYVPL